MSVITPLIRGVDYDPSLQSLTIRFAVGTYDYLGVPPHRAAELKQMLEERRHTDAVIYFNRSIEGKYKSVRTGD